MNDFDRETDVEIDHLRVITEAFELLNPAAHPRMLRYLVGRYMPTAQIKLPTKEIICQHCGEVAS